MLTTPLLSNTQEMDSIVEPSPVSVWFRTCLFLQYSVLAIMLDVQWVNSTFCLDYPLGNPRDDTELHQLGVGVWTTT